MTRDELNAALELLGEVRRITGASSIHAQLFDVGQGELDVMVAAGGRVCHPSPVVEMLRDGVELDAFAAPDGSFTRPLGEQG